MAAYKTKCWYEKDEMQCIGKPVLKGLWWHNETTWSTYFIGCSGWKLNEKFYQFISIKENIDLTLLYQLLNEIYEVK